MQSVSTFTSDMQIAITCMMKVEPTLITVHNKGLLVLLVNTLQTQLDMCMTLLCVSINLARYRHDPNTTVL